MCSGAIVVLLVRAQQATQMLLAEDDHVIDALASDRAKISLEEGPVLATRMSREVQRTVPFARPGKAAQAEGLPASV